MPGLVPGIHVLLAARFEEDVDGRDTSAFTRVHNPLKTGVNALFDALCPAMTVYRLGNLNRQS
jgi:hypothetical protein